MKNCKPWYTALGGTPAAMRAACTAPPTPDAARRARPRTRAASSTRSRTGAPTAHDVGPFFAETQADLVLSFGRVLGGVTKSATTRTLPGYAPAVTVSGRQQHGLVHRLVHPERAEGVVRRDRPRRARSASAPSRPRRRPQSVTEGDSYSANLAAQTVAANRLFISVTGQATAGPPLVGTVIDSARTIRPYATAVPIDGIPAFVGTEVAGIDDTLKGSTNWAQAIDIQPDIARHLADLQALERRRAHHPRERRHPRPLAVPSARDVMWDFETAHYGSIKPSGPWEFNVRCTTVGQPGGRLLFDLRRGLHRRRPERLRSAGRHHR